MTRAHAVYQAQRRADDEDRRYVVWKHTRSENAYVVTAFGAEPPSGVDVERGTVYVAVPGHVPEPSDVRSPSFRAVPMSEEDVRRIESIIAAVPGTGAGYPGDGVTDYVCEGPRRECSFEAGNTTLVVPGRNGVRLADGTILCDACDAASLAAEDTRPIARKPKATTTTVTIELVIEGDPAEALDAVNAALDTGTLQDAINEERVGDAEPVHVVSATVRS